MLARSGLPIASKAPTGRQIATAVGDFILKRRDQIVAYVLAVVVDDAAQGVTHIVRGADLLDNTPRQVYLQQLLGYAEPRYAHVPVLTEPDGAKLAKSRRSVAASADSPLPLLLSLFSLLGLAPPACLESGQSLQRGLGGSVSGTSIKYPGVSICL